MLVRPSVSTSVRPQNPSFLANFEGVWPILGLFRGVLGIKLGHFGPISEVLGHFGTIPGVSGLKVVGPFLSNIA